MAYMDTYRVWQQRQLEDPDLVLEMEQIQGNEKEIKERFIKDLEFGTAGLRGILGVGTNRMNIYPGHGRLHQCFPQGGFCGNWVRQPY